MVTRKPTPSRPIRFAAGTRRLSKITSRVDEARMPSLSSRLPNDSPGVSFSTRNAEAPRAPRDGSVIAITV